MAPSASSLPTSHCVCRAPDEGGRIEPGYDSPETSCGPQPSTPRGVDISRFASPQSHSH
ncbi:Hypothetical protein SMAX5B_010304 [Scophthalmus maximus]|uniref:Uncharacterized protein n=1 Tax=Scophthalmus maximus TaxID=52904 RepID=A0A2U9BV38_SCOMX|nr:Hypothetical protein SMAX5B_010304 [Scophthalmus maximus]